MRIGAASLCNGGTIEGKGRRVRIYDTILFDQEFELFEHRLEQTIDLVDYVVVVEAGHTFQGAPKPLHFKEALPQYESIRAKIRHIGLSSLGPPETSSWQRQVLQRNSIVLGLQDASPDDAVLVLDVDEIINRETLERIRAGELKGPTRLRMTRHYEFVNAIAPRSTCCPSSADPCPADEKVTRSARWGELEPNWFGASGIAMPYRFLTGDEASGLPGQSAYEFRRASPRAERWDDTGRHFTSVASEAKLAAKLKRVAHTEYSSDRSTYPPHLDRTRRHGVHHRGWWYSTIPEGDLPEDIQALADKHPKLSRDRCSMPSNWRRRMVRNWAWLRMSEWLPDRLVQAVDDHFDGLIYPLAPILALSFWINQIKFRFFVSDKTHKNVRAHAHD